MARGLLVTLKNLTKKPFTVQYPEERVKQHPRFRGEEFVWYEERCTGCASCAKYCPLGIIKIETSPSETNPQQGDKYRLEVFDIQISRCMFCGLCVEACPYDALFMGSGFEQGRYSRKEMVIGIDDLRQANKNPSTFFRPQLEEGNYDPRSGKPLDWREVGRESWPWHLKEKAGMRLTRPALPGDSALSGDSALPGGAGGSPDQSAEDPDQAPVADQDRENGPATGNAA
jgi:NADH-quinone oxidoreductase subunit I